MASEIDEHAATELSLYIDNDSHMYERQRAFVSNVKKKIKAGKYNPSLAPKLWIVYVEEGAKRYMKEIAGSGKVSDVFNKATRDYLAREYATEAYNKIMRGEL